MVFHIHQTIGNLFLPQVWSDYNPAQRQYFQACFLDVAKDILKMICLLLLLDTQAHNSGQVNDTRTLFYQHITFGMTLFALLQESINR